MKIAIELDDCIRDSFPLWEDFIKSKKVDSNPKLIREMFIINNLIKKELLLKDDFQEWKDMQDLAPSFVQSEIKINDWYDKDMKIGIFTDGEDPNAKKWLKDHYIPYDIFCESADIVFLNGIFKLDRLIVSNYKKCLKEYIGKYKQNRKTYESWEKIFIIKNEFNSEENILKEMNLEKLPENVFLTDWSEIEL